MGARVETASAGVCSACGRRPATRRLKVSESFTAYPDFFSGGWVCEVCAQLIEDRRFRSSHWLLVDGAARTLSKEELLQVLRDPPVGSLVYVRSSGRRHGFIRALRFASSKTIAAVCGEDEGVLLVPKERLRSLVDLAVEAYAVLKRKRALLEGCSAPEWRHEGLCKKIEEVRGDPVWRIVVRAL